MIDGFTLVVTAAAGLLVATALVLWEQILEWARDSVLPWFREHLPMLEGVVSDAFVKLDSKMSHLRRSIKLSWEKIRGYLLKQVVELNQNSSKKWIRRITAWLMPVLKGSNSHVTKIVSEQELPWDELPPDVREAVLRQQKRSFNNDVTAERDQELAQIH